MDTKNQYIKWIIALVLLLAFGTFGYVVIEGWDYFDALYMTVITVVTVGFSEVHPLSQEGRVFTIFLSLGGVGLVLYVVNGLVKATLEGEFGLFRRQRMEAKIKNLNGHFILCGYGRVGEAIANTLKTQQADFVVIDQSLNSYTKAVQQGFLSIMDDATNHETLKRAGVEKAKCLITAFGEDAYNTYAVLTARELNPRLIIIGRASNNDASKRLRQAGATHIILPEVLGGQQMAHLALRPTTVQFIDSVLSGKEGEYMIEEIHVSPDSKLIGKSVKDLEEQFPGIRILAMKNREGQSIINPSLATVVEMGGSLTSFGTLENLRAVENYCAISPTTSGGITPDL